MLFGRREKPRFFVKTQGFEKRFLQKNLVRYFGDDIAWTDAVDVDTGHEGLELYSPLQEQTKKIIVSRMKADALKQYHSLQERRKLEREGTSLVDRWPQIAAARAPHLDLFPPLDDLFEPSPSTATHLAPRALPHRHSHSVPTTPLAEFSAPQEFPRAPTRRFFDQEAIWANAASYGEPDYWAMDAGVPQLQIDRAPTVRINAPLSPPLRHSRSAEGLEGSLGYSAYPEPGPYYYRHQPSW